MFVTNLYNGGGGIALPCLGVGRKEQRDSEPYLNIVTSKFYNLVVICL